MSAPVVVFATPTSSATYGTSSGALTIAGRATDDVGVISVQWSNDRGGSGAATGLSDWTVGGIVLQSGANVITVTARDAAGNAGRSTLTVTYAPPGTGATDTQSPAVVIVSPTGTGSYSTTSATVSVSGTASDNVAVTQVSWANSRGGSGVAAGQAQWTAASIPLQTGVNVLTLTARDAAGNAATATLSVSYVVADTAAPTIAVSSPTTSASYASSTSSVSVSGTSADNVGVTQVTWTNDRGGSGTANGTTSWSISSIALQSGANVLTFTARDAAGNATTRTLTVSYTRTNAQTFYLSPSGSDANDGVSAGTPLKSFARAFTTMTSGDELVLLDGTYSASAGTGTIHWNNGSASAQIPSGTAQRPTVVRAQNPGAVKILGPLFVGRSNRKDSYIRVQGITFEGGGSLYNSSFVTLKDVGFHGPFDIGTNDHDQGNTDNLVEDAWIWSSGVRVVAINYRAHRNVWRRVVVRGDGCGTSECSGSGNPNVGFTVYDSMDVSVQNVMVIDRVLAGSDSPYADFACAQHTADPRYYFGRNEWLGVLSLNAPDIGFYCEPDDVIDGVPTFRLLGSVFWNSRAGGVNVARAGQRHQIQGLRIRSGGDGFRFAPELSRSGAAISDIEVDGEGRYALNSAVEVIGGSIRGRWRSTVNQAGCRGCSAPQVPDASPDPPGTHLARYGVDGTRYGDSGYAESSGRPLWPWPNEARIRTEMCVQTARGFCAEGKTLTTYVAGSDAGKAAPTIHD